jgi:hypothetical protein
MVGGSPSSVEVASKLSKRAYLLSVVEAGLLLSVVVPFCIHRRKWDLFVCRQMLRVKINCRYDMMPSNAVLYCVYGTYSIGDGAAQHYRIN